MSAPRLAMLSFRDVVVTPYVELLQAPFGGKAHWGGPRWPDWSGQMAARHCRQGAPVDDEPPEAEPKSILSGPVAWGGAIAHFLGQGHFGHQIADFSTRLLPTLAETPDIPFAFGVRENLRHKLDTMEKLPAYFHEILDWYGIGSDRVQLIAEPTLIERLVVAPQAEQLGGPGPEEWYLDMLDAHAASRLGEIERNGSIYVTRGTQLARFAGEAYLEGLLEATGFRALRPETMPLEDQLRAYAGAESIIFSEGSAVHGPQLIGRALGDVTILNRQAGGRLGREELTPRARSLRYVDAIRGLVYAKDTERFKGQGIWRALYILDPEKLEAGLGFGSAWDRRAFDAAIEADIAEWLETERASPRWELPGSAEQVREQLSELGFSHLAA